MCIVKFRRGWLQPATPSTEKVTRCYKAISLWRQDLERAPEIYPIGATDVEIDLIRQGLIAALNGGG